MLLDLSTYGFIPAFQKGAKVLGYHIFSAAVVAGLAALGEDLGSLKIAHPVYGVYLAAAIAGVNVVTVIITHWLISISPDTSSPTTTAPVATASGL